MEVLDSKVLEVRQTNSVDEVNSLLRPEDKHDRWGNYLHDPHEWILMHSVVRDDGETIFTLGRVSK